MLNVSSHKGGRVTFRSDKGERVTSENSREYYEDPTLLSQKQAQVSWEQTLVQEEWAHPYLKVGYPILRRNDPPGSTNTCDVKSTLNLGLTSSVESISNQDTQLGLGQDRGRCLQRKGSQGSNNGSQGLSMGNGPTGSHLSTGVYSKEKQRSKFQVQYYLNGRPIRNDFVSGRGQRDSDFSIGEERGTIRHNTQRDSDHVQSQFEPHNNGRTGIAVLVKESSEYNKSSSQNLSAHNTGIQAIQHISNTTTKSHNQIKSGESRTVYRIDNRAGHERLVEDSEQLKRFRKRRSRSDPLNKVLKDLPIEVLCAGRKRRSSFESALLRGGRQINHSRVILLGYARAGKSSLLSCLLDNPFDEAYNPTNGIYANPSQTKIHLSTDGWAKYKGETFGYNEITLYFWDFAGQLNNAFYTTHPMFFTARSIYLMVLDMTKGCTVQIDARDNPGENASDRGYQQTVSEYMDYWMSLLSLQNVDDGCEGSSNTPQPQVIIVGTHKDELSNHVDQFAKDITKAVSSKPYSAHIHKHIFTISNKDRAAADVKKLKDAIELLARDQFYEMPLSWYKMRDLLKAGEKKQKTWAEACEAAKQAGVHMDEVRFALLFLHSIGEIIYFDDLTLRDFIITEPYWVIEQMQKVFSVRGFYIQQRFSKSSMYWRHFHEYGILHEEVLKNIWPPNSRIELQEVMKKLALLLLMPIDYESECPADEFDKGEVLYLVPCMLQPRKCIVALETDAPTIVLQTTRKFIPVGLTSRLITHLINEQGWKVDGKIYQDAATFITNARKTPVVIQIQQKDHLLVINGNAPTNSLGVLRKKLAVLVANLHCLTSTVCPLQPFKIGIMCLQCKNQERLTLLRPGENLPEYCNCEVDGRVDNTKYHIWFEDLTSAPNENPDPSTDEDDICSLGMKVIHACQKVVLVLVRKLVYEKLLPIITEYCIFPAWRVQQLKGRSHDEKIKHLIQDLLPQHTPLSAVLLIKAIIDTRQLWIIDSLGLTPDDIHLISHTSYTCDSDDE